MADTIVLVYLGLVLCWTSVLAQKSHTLSINKLEPLEVNAEWIKNDSNMWLTRKDRSVKVFNWKGTIKKDITGDVLCKVKVLQKMNGNFVPTTMDTAEKPCCESMDDYNIIWPCLKKFSNFPDKCPIPAGEYWIEKLDLNDCQIPIFLPPKSPEEYKIIFTGKDKSKLVFTMIGYGTAKRKLLG